LVLVVLVHASKMIIIKEKKNPSSKNKGKEKIRGKHRNKGKDKVKNEDKETERGILFILMI